jgi:type III secretion protein U
MSEKTEPPSDQKLEDARKKGQVPVSRDLAKLASLVVVAEIAFGTEAMWRTAINTKMNLALMRIGQPFEAAMGEMLTSVGLMLLAVFATLFIICPVVAVASYWGQFGVLISPESITPKLDKLNPVNGVMQLFSKKKLMELGMALIKGSVIGLMVYSAIRDQLPTIILFSGGVPKDIYLAFIELIRSIFHTIVGICLFLGLIDFAIQKQAHIKSLMMSTEDIKREFKESEGDPQVKGQRKQIARDLSQSDPASQTAGANAVVVNPTHFAVAMFYDIESGKVPKVLAKGKDETAQAMIRRARQCNIPVIRHVWLARTLYATGQANAVIPRSSYEAVAHVYAVIEELRDTPQFNHVVELENYGDDPSTARS